MRFSILKSGALIGLQVRPIDVEIDITRGLFSFTIVGLADKVVAESKERILVALKNSGFASPKTKNQKIVVSLAPAYFKKEGTAFDISIAISYLKASEEISSSLEKKIFLGELSLDGCIKPVKGIIPLLQFAMQNGFTEAYVPFAQKMEAILVKNIKIYPLQNLRQLTDHLDNIIKISPLLLSTESATQDSISSENKISFSDIQGQQIAKRALVIAAAGGHNIILSGEPGTGKTMLAKAFTSLLPKLTLDQCIETTSLYSLIESISEPIWLAPFRAPHHTSSYTSLIGGGNNIRPGEISLANNGVLFLDELAEFDLKVIETLREPLEEQVVRISRAKQSETFPAKCIVIAALNPCPCGYKGSNHKRCTCSAHSIIKYKKKLSGPFIDRIDLWVNVEHEQFNFDHEKNVSTRKEEETTFQKNVAYARHTQEKRYFGFLSGKLNAQISGPVVEKYANLSKPAKDILLSASKELSISMRAFHKTIKVARTIADLEGSREIKEVHILESLSYRPKVD